MYALPQSVFTFTYIYEYKTIIRGLLPVEVCVCADETSLLSQGDFYGAMSLEPQNVLLSRSKTTKGTAAAENTEQLYANSKLAMWKAVEATIFFFVLLSCCEIFEVLV